jgi:glutamine synthetase
MHPSDVTTAADARKIVEERDLRHVKVGVFDADGILRGKYMSRAKFFSSLENKTVSDSATWCWAGIRKTSFMTT